VRLDLDPASPARMDLLARSLLASIPGSGFVLFGTDLEIKVVEGPAADRAGLRTDTAAGRPLAEALTGDTWVQLERRFRDVLAGKPSQGVVRGRHGHRYGMSAVPVPGPDGTVVAGIAMFCDDTDRHRDVPRQGARPRPRGEQRGVHG
jgi:hypothetical protein